MHVLALVLALVACKHGDTDTGDSSPPDTDTDTPDPATVPLAGECELADDYGGFVAQSGGDSTGVQGKVANGVVPVTILETIAEEGGCKLLRQNNPVCTPACDPNQTCDFDGTCIDYPLSQDLGTVTIDGLVAPVEMEPVFPGNTYYDTSLADPPWTAGEVVTLEMPAGTYGPVELHGVGLEPHTSLDAEWVAEAGVDLNVSWQPPTSSVVRSEVVLWIHIDQHGASPASLECVFADTGSGTVPGDLIDQLVSVGVSGFPSGTLERRTADKADLPGGGCMDFVLRTPVDVPVDVAGYTPCVNDNDCPDGQTCNLELQICEST